MGARRGPDAAETLSVAPFTGGADVSANIQKIGYQVGIAVLNQLAIDSTLGHISTATADSLQLGMPVDD